MIEKTPRQTRTPNAETRSLVESFFISTCLETGTVGSGDRLCRKEMLRHRLV
jgi:hypothetical protein